MKSMSSQQARDFWTYLHEQAESYKQSYFQGGQDHAYKDEMRAAAETYDWLAEEFSKYAAAPANAANDIHNGLTAEKAKEFLHFLDKRIDDLATSQEQTREKRQEALSKANALEYYNVKRIYKEMENLTDRQAIVYRNSRERFVSIVQTEL